MKEKKNTCPVCFTKMQVSGHTLVCPECGYKYCDHSYDNRDLYSTNHTHEPNYTTSYKSGSAYSYDTGNSSRHTNSGNSRTTSAGGSYSSGSNSSSHAASAGGSYSSGSRTASTGRSYSSGSNTGSATSAAKAAHASKMERRKKKRPLAIAIFLFSVIITISSNISSLISSNSGSSSGSSSGGNILPTSDPSALYNALHIGLEEPEYKDGDFFLNLIGHIFGKDYQEVSEEELLSVVGLSVFCSYPNTFYAYYAMEDGTTDSYLSSLDGFRTSDLKYFIGLESLYVENLTLQPGDLDGLDYLYDLACLNTPEELLQIVDPEQIYYLELVLPKDTENLNGLHHFQNLETLLIDADDANITDAYEISTLPELMSLSYSDHGSLKNFDFLRQMPKLSYLDLSARSLDNIDFIEDLPLLRMLIVQDTMLSDLTPLTHTTELTQLTLDYNENLSDFSPIGELSSLRHLYLDNTTLDNLDFASNLTELRTLGIQSTRVTSLAPLKDLPNLEVIDATYSPIRDYAGLERLVEGSNL